MTILCKEVTVAFSAPGKQTQLINATQMTACHMLAVTANEHFVSVTYMTAATKTNPAGFPLKIVCYNTKSIIDFACADSVQVLDDK